MHLVISAVFLIATPWSLHAQDAGAAGNVQPVGHGLSFNAGPMLPKGAPVSDEIMKGFAIRYDYPFSAATFIEAGMLFANSDGHYQDLAASFRFDLPFQDLTIFALAGPDLVRMKHEGGTFTYYGGFHAGTGVLAHILDQTFLRMEMRFNLHPGTILLFTFGLEFHFGNGASSSN